ncbi:MAG: DNA-binding protein WhiA [Eubacteriales bacterium]|nr:DNA-binding protein WhiA [Eubacteriales bacterium]
MSFSSDVKAELCQTRIDKKSTAVAECYGVLMYCNTFSPTDIRIITAGADFARRLPRLFRRAFSLNFDYLPDENCRGKRSFEITDEEKIAVILDAYGAEADTMLTHHVNFGVLEDEADRAAFIRGAFLAGGSVTAPEKSYHLELATPHRSVSREVYSLLLDMGFSPRETHRAGNSLLYFKQADAIADFFTAIGASGAAMDVMTAKVDKEMRNTVTRQINCDAANADKTVAAAQNQIRVIKSVIQRYGLEALDDTLRDTAILRITNPEASLADLARLSIPPVSKSTLNYRLSKLMKLSVEEE